MTAAPVAADKRNNADIDSNQQKDTQAASPPQNGSTKCSPRMLDDMGSNFRGRQDGLPGTGNKTPTPQPWLL